MGKNRPDTVMAFKADTELRGRIDAHVDRMKKQTPGVSFTTSDALRNLVMIGLEKSETKKRQRKA